MADAATVESDTIDDATVKMAGASPHLRIIELKRADSIGDLSVPNEPYFIEETQPSWFGRWGLFLFMVVLPVLSGILYYGFIASDQYASEASFYVRASTNSDSGAGPLAVLTPSGSFTRSQEDTYALNEYLRSRDMVDLLVKEDGLRDIFSRPGADFIARFPNFLTKDNRESIFEHFRKFVTVTIDGTTSISLLEVRAFRPEDSQRLAVALLKHGEKLINELNARATHDAVRIAESEVKQAEQRLEVTQDKMSEYRNRELVLDPVKQSTAMIAGISKLSTEVARLQAQLAQTAATTPNSPQISPLKDQIKALQNQVDQQRLAIVGGDSSMASKIVEFDKLTLERELAVKSLASAFVSLETARHDAQKQQLYLETITQPHLADQAAYPKRLLTVFLILTMSLCLFWLINSAVNVIREHRP